MKKIFILLLSLLSFLTYGQTVIPTTAFHGDITNVSLVADSTYLVTINPLTDNSGVKTGTAIDASGSFVIWKDCKKYIITSITCGTCNVFSGSATVEVTADVAANGSPLLGNVEIIEETSLGLSLSYVGNSATNIQQCIFAYYTDKLNSLINIASVVDSTRLNAGGDTLFYYQNGVQIGFGLVNGLPTIPGTEISPIETVPVGSDSTTTIAQLDDYFNGIITVNDIAHGFSVGDALFWNDTNIGVADNTENGQAQFLVSEIIDANTYKIARNGDVVGGGATVPGVTLVGGEWLYWNGTALDTASNSGANQLVGVYHPDGSVNVVLGGGGSEGGGTLTPANNGIGLQSGDYRLGNTFMLNQPEEFSSGRKLNWGGFINRIGKDSDSTMFVFDGTNERFGIGKDPDVMLETYGTSAQSRVRATESGLNRYMEMYHTSSRGWINNNVAVNGVLATGGTGVLTWNNDPSARVAIGNGSGGADYTLDVFGNLHSSNTSYLATTAGNAVGIGSKTNLFTAAMLTVTNQTGPSALVLFNRNSGVDMTSGASTGSIGFSGPYFGSGTSNPSDEIANISGVYSGDGANNSGYIKIRNSDATTLLINQDVAMFGIGTSNQQIQHNQYGQGNFTGTVTTLPAYTSDGTIVEVSPQNGYERISASATSTIPAGTLSVDATGASVTVTINTAIMTIGNRICVKVYTDADDGGVGANTVTIALSAGGIEKVSGGAIGTVATQVINVSGQL